MDFKNGYEKIALSKQDYSHVFDNVLQSAMDKLNLHLPGAQKDPLKNEVSTMLEEFLVNIFDSSKYSILADGRDLDETSIKDILLLRTHENVEQIDADITSKLRNILQEFETETVEVTRMRREIPIKASDVYNDVIKKVDDEVSELINQIEKEDQDNLNDEQKPVESDHEDTSKKLNKYLQLLEETNKRLPTLRTQFEEYNKTLQLLEDIYEQRHSQQTKEV